MEEDHDNLKPASRFAIVRVENEKEKILVPISSNKPEIPDIIIEKWQRIVNLVAKIMNVPTGLITRLSEKNLEIFVASQTDGNPYKRKDHDTLGIGMFCETVAGNRRKMVVQDTDTSDFWKNNPHASFGMRSYCGVPIEWEDGEVFGTFCMLTDKTNNFSDDFQRLLLEFKEIVETDLKYILILSELKKQLSESELYMREVHHRVKNHFNLLISLINLQAREENTNIEAILDDLQNRVRAISIVHEKLHSGGTRETLLSDYIKQLAEIIIHGFTGRTIKVQYDIDTVELPLDTSVPVGLIIAELLSNSLKYAFDSPVNPEIVISMKKTENSRLHIMYSDNGPGYPENLNTHKPESLGINLIRILSEQLDGKMKLDNNNGAVYSSVVDYTKKNKEAP